MDKKQYKQAMQQISTDKDDIATIAKQMKKHHDEQKKQSIDTKADMLLDAMDAIDPKYINSALGFHNGNERRERKN